MIALAQQSNILDEVIHGEALAVLRTLPDNSVDAIVCDPPAGISFMGKNWDNYSGREKTYNSAGARAAANADKEKLKRIGQGTTPYGFSSSSGQPTRKERDAFISFIREVMAEALRALKPGGHAFVWALPRTSHWTGIALEDAGFEIRDVVTHLFGSGFPKSADISKAIDRMQGAEREVVGIRSTYRPNSGALKPKDGFQDRSSGLETAPATPEASQWDGWGTALKPASENWWLCRKPLSEPTIAANVLKWGTGAINIDATRVHSIERPLRVRDCKDEVIQNAYGAGLNGSHAVGTTTQGRFPANLLLSHSVWCVPNGVKKVKQQGGHGEATRQAVLHRKNVYGKMEGHVHAYCDSEGMEQVEDWLCDESCPIRLLDEQSGMRKSGGRTRHIGDVTKHTHIYHPHTAASEFEMERSEGGASRYFMRFYPFIYQAKASRAERNSGCEGLPEKQGFDKNTSRLKRMSNPDTGEAHYIENHLSAPVANSHPCVKPIQLMRYLVRMITPPGGIVLDCFAGSGSTLVAAIHEGMHFIGIEMNDSEQEPYVTIARARIEQAFREVQS